MTSTDAVAAQPTPDARVRAFIADYHRVHGESSRIIASSDFDAWKKVVDRLTKAHFVAGGRSGLGNSMSSAADHHPESEKIDSNVPDGDGVLIQTQDPAAPITRYYEYRLRKVGSDWRIVSLNGYVESADEPFMTPQQREQFTHPKTHAFRALPKREAALDGAGIFKKGEVRRVGTLNVSTGIVVVGDLGYDPMVLASLGQRIALGQYAVEISISDERVAAMRVLITDEPVVKWHPADMGEGGHVVGVDAANVSVCDVSALTTIKTRHKEKQFEKFAEASEQSAAFMLTLVNANDCAIATSGYGDGAYPVYWGVDAAGKPAVLLVDMLVLTELPDE